QLMMETGKKAPQIAKEEGFLRIDDPEIIKQYIEQVFKENQKAVNDALKDPKAVHFLVGQVMRLTKGCCDPPLLNKLIKEKLESLK
ncbi:MAG: Asp-tRNA(Asn)/Glu-tRNA(Gln) amidotransferase subunit GatB, partial [Candidatus Helarchaeota archaeon]